MPESVFASNSPLVGYLQRLVRQLPGVVWATDTELRFTLSDGSGLDSLHVRPGELVGTSLYEYFHTQKENFPTIAAHRRALNGEVVNYVQTWSGRTYQVHLEPLRNAANDIAGCVGIALDITEQHRVETELKLATQRYRGLAESTLDIIYVLDREGRLTYANRAAANYIGIDPNRLVGRSQRELFPPEMAERHLDRVRRVLETGRVVEEDEHFTFGPREVWLSVRLMPMHDEDGQVTSIMGVCRDITQRKEAERWLADKRDELEREVQRRTEDLVQANAALRESRDELQTIYDGMVDGVVILDIETRATHQVNPALCRMLGYTAEELIALPDEDIYPPGEAPYWMAQFDEHAAGRASRNEGVPLVRKDGSVLLADITTSRIEYKGRECLIAFLRDVTERHRAEEALRREKQSLARLLRAVDHDRQIIAYEIHDGLAQLIAGALMQFQTFASARDRKPEKAEEAFQTAMQILRDSHREVRHLISGVRPPILDEFGLLAAISNLVDGFSGRGGPEIEYTAEVDFERLAKVEENSIYRIVQEALTNSWQHSGSPRIRLRLEQHDDQLHLTIQDWGTGFHKERVHDDHFGLHGISERARMLGGRAEIETRPGEGTRIAVQVPVIERDPAEE